MVRREAKRGANAGKAFYGCSRFPGCRGEDLSGERRAEQAGEADHCGAGRSVRRNQQRFPADFIFEVSDEEVRNLMSQFATSSWGGTRKRPLAFTEHGAIMAATVLNSPGAVEMSVFVVRAFVQFRTALLSTRELAKRLDALERHVATKLTVHDRALTNLLQAIRSLTESPATKKRPIGFTADLDGSE
jgi:ssDNA-binding Zn-finger/Zn-ribbon topoisomerase 1